MGELAPILGMDNKTVPAKELSPIANMEAEIAGLYIDVMMRHSLPKYRTPTLPSTPESTPTWALN